MCKYYTALPENKGIKLDNGLFFLPMQKTLAKLSENKCLKGGCFLPKIDFVYQ